MILAFTALALAPLATAGHTQNSCIDMLGGNVDTWFLGFDGLRYYLVMDNGHGMFLHRKSNGIDGLQWGSGTDPCRTGLPPDSFQFSWT